MSDVSDEELARLWNHYVEVSQHYSEACRVTDQAHAAVDAAYEQETTLGQAMMLASQAFACAARDVVFLHCHGISPVPLGHPEGQRSR